jgi:hypothetical protein
MVWASLHVGIAHVTTTGVRRASTVWREPWRYVAQYREDLSGVAMTCTICGHPERQAIDKALVTKQPYRHIAPRFAVSTRALQRHAAEHLLATIVDAWQAERHRNGLELADELRAWMDTLTKLLRACDDWLTDPDDTTRYDLSPRAHEIMVVYEAPVAAPVRPALVDGVVAAARALVATAGREERVALLAAVERLNRHDGVGAAPGDDEAIHAVASPRMTRRKARLSDLLARVDGEDKAGVVTMLESKVADPRKLIVDTSKALEGHLRLLGELVGKLQTQGTTNFLVSPEWGALRARMIAALAAYPDARLALAEALEEGQEG